MKDIGRWEVTTRIDGPSGAIEEVHELTGDTIEDIYAELIEFEVNEFVILKIEKV